MDRNWNSREELIMCWYVIKVVDEEIVTIIVKKKFDSVSFSLASFMTERW